MKTRIAYQLAVALIPPDLVACALDFGRYDPTDAAAAVPSVGSADAGPLCPPSSCIGQNGACASVCITRSSNCGAACMTASCRRGCTATEQTCLAQCSATCATCTQRAGCAAASDCDASLGGG